MEYLGLLYECHDFYADNIAHAYLNPIANNRHFQKRDGRHSFNPDHDVVTKLQSNCPLAVTIPSLSTNSL